MTDEELGKHLGLTPAEAAIAIPKLEPERRRAYVRLIEVSHELNLWSAGHGPKPKGVLIDTERAVNKRRGWRRAGWRDNADEKQSGR